MNTQKIERTACKYTTKENHQTAMQETEKKEQRKTKQLESK